MNVAWRTLKLRLPAWVIAIPLGSLCSSGAVSDELRREPPPDIEVSVVRDTNAISTECRLDSIFLALRRAADSGDFASDSAFGVDRLETLFCGRRIESGATGNRIAGIIRDLPAAYGRSDPSPSISFSYWEADVAVLPRDTLFSAVTIAFAPRTLRYDDLARSLGAPTVNEGNIFSGYNRHPRLLMPTTSPAGNSEIKYNFFHSGFSTVVSAFVNGDGSIDYLEIDTKR
jgi:hypothetical protein